MIGQTKTGMKEEGRRKRGKLYLFQFKIIKAKEKLPRTQNITKHRT
jgi:hypothetical protein